MVRAGLDAFLEIVRQGHAETPIVVVSPVVRPDAEATANRLGATLADLRSAIEDVVATRAERDARLSLVPGATLLSPGQLPDGIHPGDEGHAALAAAIGPLIASAAVAVAGREV
jgi:lysophospholipase L1-like esterase